MMHNDEANASMMRNQAFPWRGFAAMALAAAGFIAMRPDAQATTISGYLSADNAFYAYISTDDATLGTLIASGDNYGTAFAIPATALTPGVTNYLHIEAINTGEIAALYGNFTLSDTGFAFANGSQTLLTDMADWLGGYNDDSSAITPQPWVEPTGDVLSYGANTYPWNNITDIDTSDDDIWPNDSMSAPDGYYACTTCTVDFSTAIDAEATAMPEPGTATLLASTLAGITLFRRRRSRT